MALASAGAAGPHQKAGSHHEAGSHQKAGSHQPAFASPAALQRRGGLVGAPAAGAEALEVVVVVSVLRQVEGGTFLPGVCSSGLALVVAAVVAAARASSEAV